MTTNHFDTDRTFTMVFLTMYVRWRLPRRLGIRIIDGVLVRRRRQIGRGRSSSACIVGNTRTVLVQYPCCTICKTQPSLHFRDRSLVRQNFIPTLKMRFMQPPSRKLRTEGCPSHDDGKKALLKLCPGLAWGLVVLFFPYCLIRP